MIVIESLAQEFVSMFGRKMKIVSRECASAPFAENKRKLLQERNKDNKEKFLYDLNMSGKYKILKETLKKPIIKIVREYFKKTDSFKGINIEKKDRDQFYS